MSYLLKIVRGPNAGAEIALVEGLSVSIGKGESCDIVLADPTLPDSPLQLETEADGVALTSPDGGREHLKPYHVKTFGSTAFAIGPAESAWENLVEEAPAKPEAAAEEPASEPAAEKPIEKKAEKEEKGGRGAGFLLFEVLAAAIVLALLWFGWKWHSSRYRTEEKTEPAFPTIVTIESLASKYGLAEKEVDGRKLYTGNFKSRAARLAAAGEIYAACPGANLDLSDDESFRMAAEDMLFMLTGGDLEVIAATNRILSVKGITSGPASLKAVLEALAADIPKLENVICSGVRFGDAPHSDRAIAERTKKEPNGSVLAAIASEKPRPEFPVCGILTAPVPCLVMKNGARVLEGAAFEGFIIEKISADEVVVTNGSERIVWKP